MSLTSTFVFDLFTDKIVAEYTGRLDYADDNYEIVRLLCLFYNGKCLYENNKKGLFAYFQRMRGTHLLAETPEYLRDKQLIKSIGYGNTAYGVNANKAINNYANDLIKNWLISTKVETIQEGDNIQEVTTMALQHIKSRALLKELILYNPDINVDRIRALGMVMLYRESYVALTGGNFQQAAQNSDPSYLGNDKFFTDNYRQKEDSTIAKLMELDKKFGFNIK